MTTLSWSSHDPSSKQLVMRIVDVDINSIYKYRGIKIILKRTSWIAFCFEIRRSSVSKFVGFSLVPYRHVVGTTPLAELGRALSKNCIKKCDWIGKLNVNLNRFKNIPFPSSHKDKRNKSLIQRGHATSLLGTRNLECLQHIFSYLFVKLHSYNGFAVQ